MPIIDITDATFAKEVLESTSPVLVDFHMEAGCGPCRDIAPKVAEIASDLEGDLKVVKLDYLGHRETANRFAVTGFPTLMIFWGGGLRSVIRGNRPIEQLQSWVGTYMNEYTYAKQRREEAARARESQTGQTPGH